MTEMIHEDVDRPDDLPEDAIYDGDPEPHINSDADAESSLESIVYWERKREEAAAAAAALAARPALGCHRPPAPARA